MDKKAYLSIAIAALLGLSLFFFYSNGYFTKEQDIVEPEMQEVAVKERENLAIGTKRSAEPETETKPETKQQTYEEPIKPDVQKVAFYNVENLFDTVDEPGKDDEGFTPKGALNWTKARYKTKLDNISKVVRGMAFPELLGLCEVENKTVLKDLIKHPDLAKEKYRFVHYESPDKRGIDCAFLYKKDIFKVEDSEYIRINFPKKIVTAYTTRDLLYIKGQYMGKEMLHIFVVHWPSRRGGSEASEPKRVYVAQQVKKKIDNLLKKDPNANIIVMGDFNDTPANKSVADILKAQSPDKIDNQTALYNCSLPLFKKGIGSHNYKGEWNMLDQIIVSKSLLDNDGLKASYTKVYQKKEITFYHPKYGLMPNRTYSGPNYYGGFSDHLPIYIELD